MAKKRIIYVLCSLGLIGIMILIYIKVKPVKPMTTEYVLSILSEKYWIVSYDEHTQTFLQKFPVPPPRVTKEGELIEYPPYYMYKGMSFDGNRYFMERIHIKDTSKYIYFKGRKYYDLKNGNGEWDGLGRRFPINYVEKDSVFNNAYKILSISKEKIILKIVSKFHWGESDYMCMIPIPDIIIDSKFIGTKPSGESFYDCVEWEQNPNK